MPLPKGWHYEPGRHYAIGPNGQRATRQAAENMQAQQWGFKNVRDLQKAQKSSGYQKAKGKGKPGEGYTQNDFNAAKAKYYSDPANKNDRSPDGPLAKYLESQGRREPNSPDPVGESPTYV